MEGENKTIVPGKVRLISMVILLEGILVSFVGFKASMDNITRIIEFSNPSLFFYRGGWESILGLLFGITLIISSIKIRKMKVKGFYLFRISVAIFIFLSAITLMPSFWQTGDSMAMLGLIIAIPFWIVAILNTYFLIYLWSIHEKFS